MAEMARHVAARNGMPAFRPYVYQGTGEDIYQGAHGTRRRDHREVILPGPEDVSYGWRREQLADPASPPPPAARCGTCGYLVTAIGHKVMCDV